MGAAVHPVARPTSSSATTARIDGRQHGRAKQQWRPRAPPPNPPPAPPPAASPPPGPQCRNASTLALANPLPGDGKITFVEEGHAYTVFGQPIERSTTRVLGTFFAEREYLRDEWFQKWKADRNHKYFKIIKQALDAGGDDEAAKAAIRASWEAKGAEASRLGTALHLHCEYDLNGEVSTLRPSPEPDPYPLAVQISPY